MSSPMTNWTEANQRYLMAALGEVREALERHAGSEITPAPPAPEMPSPAALDILSTRFRLSAFERGVLLLCAGVELEASFGARFHPTFSLALAALPGAHWSALTPAAPLRHWRLIEIGSGPVLTLAPLRIDERILHYLAGVQHIDERLAGLVEPFIDVEPRGEVAPLAPSHEAIADRIAAAWTRALPVVQLCGDDVADHRAIAAAACGKLGLNVAIAAAQALPTGAAELEGLMRLWRRESILSDAALLLECRDLDAADAARAAAIHKLIEGATWPLIVSTPERRRARSASSLTIDVRKPSPGEQRDLWRDALRELPVTLNGELDALASQFDLPLHRLHAAAAEVLASPNETPRDLGTALWDACRLQARPRLDDLAQRIEPAAAWGDLVLPEAQLRPLREMAAHVRRRALVYDEWDFASKGKRGLGISALFSGVSGTGKTMAAEVLARELRLDLYRIDLSAVVSKYIGETEKNLRRVFDAAEEGGAILLFDEADALFGKRSEVKDSHDRYANIEVSYLLQRMESYRGLAILTTNLKSALDTAFLRRIRFIVHFPFPDTAQREEIWRRIFPSRTPTENLDAAKLARLNVAGGNIRSIALSAAFLAAEAGEPVRMSHLLHAAQSEYAKLEKAMSDGEVRGWV
jgi:ATPase family protein associated with various cellular activities (AAA)